MAELATLATVARSQSSEATFRSAVSSEKADVTERLRHFEGLIEASSSDHDVKSPGVWRLLKALAVEMLWMDDPASTRTSAVGLLTRHGGQLALLKTPQDTFRVLAELSSFYAKTGGDITRESLIERTS